MINFPGNAFLVNIRWLTAIAVSLSLHLAALALLSTFISSQGTPSARPTGVPDAPLIVRIENAKSGTLPAASSRQRLAQKAKPLKAAPATNDDVPFPFPRTPFPRYFQAAELDVLPEIQQRIELYPDELRSTVHGGGKVVIRLWIDETGHVVKAEPVSSDLPAIFVEIAARTFMQAGFLPGRKNNSAVKSRVEAVLFYPSRDS